MDKLPGAIGGGPKRIPFVRFDECETGGGCHLNNSGLSVGEDTELCIDLVFEWGKHTVCLEVSTGGINKRLHCPFTTVRHRYFLNDGIGKHAAESRLDRTRSFESTDTPFK